MSAEAWDYLFKFSLVGDLGVGKTSLQSRFCDSVWLDGARPPTASYAGVDFRIRSINLDGLIVACQLWDNAGVTRFKSVQSSYFRGAHCVLAVYDVASAESFRSLTAWLQEAAKSAPEHALRYVVGAKDDLPARAVPQDEVQRLVAAFNATHIEVSAKTGDNVEVLFAAAARTTLGLATFPFQSAYYVSPLSKEWNGYLLKRGHFVKSWRKRHFRLRKGLLSYFESESSGKPLGVIGLRDCSLARGDEPGLFALAGIVKGKRKEFYLKAEKGDTEREEWLAALTDLKDVTAKHLNEILIYMRTVEHRYAVQARWKDAVATEQPGAVSVAIAAQHPCQEAAQAIVHSLVGLPASTTTDWTLNVELTNFHTTARNYTKMALHVAQALHKRIGSASPLAMLPPPLLGSVLRHLEPPDASQGVTTPEGSLRCTFSSYSLTSDVPPKTQGLAVLFDCVDEYSFMGAIRFLTNMCANIEYIEVSASLDRQGVQSVVGAVLADVIVKRRPFPWAFKLIDKLYLELAATEAQVKG
eukprot:m51a1_g170 hypothetical protein (527) ;mRNA; f:562576-564709